MYEYDTLESLRESIIRMRGEIDLNVAVFWNSKLAIFNDITRLELPMDARKTDVNVFCLCLKGSCLCSIDTRHVQLERNSYVMVFSGQTVQMLEMSEDLQCICLCVGKEHGQEMVNRLRDIVPIFMYIRQHPCIVLDEDMADWLSRFLLLFFDEMHSTNDIYRDSAADSMLSTMYYRTASMFANKLAATPLRNSRQEDIFVQFVQCLEQNFQVHREVSFYADQLCVTPKYLSTVVKAVSGRSAGACIDSYVIEEAKNLMRVTRKSVLEVSQMLNFPNQSFFGKYFKRLTGVSPYQYRKSHKE